MTSRDEHVTVYELVKHFGGPASHFLCERAISMCYIQA